MTTSNELVKKFQKSALEELHSLILYQQSFLLDLEKTINKKEACAFPISYASCVVGKALQIHNELAKANGAVLVHSK